MKKLLFIVVLVAIGSTAFGQNSCLENASNTELLNELSDRLYMDQPGKGTIIVSSTCSSYKLNVTNTDLENGTETSISIGLDNSDTCSKLSAQINTRLGSKPLQNGVIIASCSSYKLNRILASTNGELKKLPSKSLSNSDQCKLEADRLNNW